MNTKTTSVDCPNCKKAVAWTDENKSRPFCSKRCKLVDFGGWASEHNSIPGESVYPSIEDEYDQ